MNIIAILLWLATHAADIFALVRTVIDLINTLPKSERKQANDELSAALRSKDKGLIKSVAEKWKKRCNGVGCAPGLVGN